MTDSELRQIITDVLGGDIESFSRIVQAYQKPIYYYCYHMLSSTSEAEDCAQEVFLKLFHNLTSYDPNKSLEAWLYKIAYHQCVDILRRRKLTRYLPFFYQRDKDNRHVDLEIEATYFNEDVQKAMSRLSAEERNLLILRCVEDKSYDDIADILHQKTASLRKKYERTTAKFRKYFAEEKGESLNDNGAGRSGSKRAYSKRTAT
ncbi:RNA polymerase sigma factor [Paenibacillus senegalensis]|uniref:RNA polymerase sigma factor n=1 Tax=Paenibacillus senegalensis TaxID=1465766 RepID=UPI0002899386|nr:sigma-70 family RNA polymerase sigma factor [Paenibacillus senegalensis]